MIPVCKLSHFDIYYQAVGEKLEFPTFEFLRSDHEVLS